MDSTTLSELLSTLKSSIQTASTSMCEPEQLNPPKNGISLLDTKNELFLSYLQNLVFLIVLKLRQARKSLHQDPNPDEERKYSAKIRDDVVNKLVELRVYLEKGVKPLENRLRYQIDKVVRAADDAALKSALKNATISGKSSKDKLKQNGKSKRDNISDTESDESSGDEDEDGEEEIDPLSYRPNPAGFVTPAEDRNARDNSKSDGIYRPPRVTATTMPSSELRETSDRSRGKKPQRSATLDEFIANELSSAPVAEPSIGTTIRAGGRRSVNAREKKEQHERDNYEETHFIRLPKESKAERQKKNKSRPRDGGWGGEDWRDIGQGAETLIGALNAKNAREPGSKVRAALDRSRKRMRETPQGGEAKMGEAFEARKQMEKWKKRRKT